MDLATIVAVKGTKKQNIIRQTVTQLSLQQWGKENLKVRHDTLRNVTQIMPPKTECNKCI